MQHGGVFLVDATPGLNLKDPELMYLRSFEMNWQQPIGVRVLRWMEERCACIR